jgi:hypothetical protein
MHSRSFLLGTALVAFAFCACAEGASVDGSNGGTGGVTNDGSVGGAGGSATGGDGGAAGMPDGGSGGDGGSAGATGGTGGVGGTGGDTGGTGGSTGGAGGTGGNTGGTGGSTGGTGGSTGGTGGSTGGAGGTGGSTGGAGGTGGSTGGAGGTGGVGGGTGGGSSCNAPGTCTLYPQSGCGPNQGCYVVTPSTGETGCAYTAGVGLAHQCEYLEDCAAGLACVGGACKPYCRAANDCSTYGAECFQVVYDSGNGTIVDVPCMKVCSDQCDPANPSSVCASGLNCDITSDQGVKPGFSLCYDSGSTNTGSCSSASPACAPGYACLTDNKCHRWCKVGSSGCACQAAGYYVGSQEYGFCP